MKKVAFVFFNVFLMMVLEIPLVYPQGAPIPFRIGGTVTLDGVQINQASDDGLVIRVTKPDGTNYADVSGNAPEDKDGLNASNWYTINIPIYKASVQPQGAKPGETAIFHVYKNNQEFQVTNPSNGQITIGDEGKYSQIDLTVTAATSETVSPPSPPTGPASGTTGTSYSYFTGGSSSSKGHSVQYFFDWGDGTNSGWLAVGQTSAAKSWSTTGSYSVKAQARCASDTSAVSGWSGALPVNITEMTGSCEYFHDDFSGLSTNSWTYSHGNWTVQGGKLNVNQIDSNYMASARSQFIPNDYFVVDVDVEVVSPGQGGAFWIYPFTTGNVLFSVDGRTVDGVAAILFVDSGNAYLLGWDVSASEWYYSPKLATSGSITSIGVTYSSNAITLRINKQDTSLKFSGDFADAPSMINNLWLFAQGTDTHVRFDNVCADPLPNLPDLTPYQPSGWSDKIVISKSAGKYTDTSPLNTTDNLFVNFAVLNDSKVAITSRFYAALYIDGELRQKWYWDSLNATNYGYVKDYSIGSLSAGSHTVKIVADSEEAIDERNESDNEYTKTIGPDLTGEWTSVTQSCRTSRSGKSCKITGSLTLRNRGNRDAASTYVEIYLVDDLDAQEGLFVKSMSTGKIKAGKNKVIRVTYSLPAGTSASDKYIIAVIDPDDLVGEVDETNNSPTYGPIPY